MLPQLALIAMTLCWHISGAPTIHLKFLESSGATTFFDLSGHGNHPTCSASTCPATTPGILDRALDFDGSNDVLTITDNATIDPSTAFTISIWVRPDSAYGDSSNPGLMSKKGQGWGGMWITSAGVLWGRFIQSGGSTVNFSQNETLAANAWSHIVQLADPGGPNIYQYVNGTQVDSKSYDGTLRVGADNLTIGEQGSSENFNGLIDEVITWNEALTRGEVRALYLSQRRQFIDPNPFIVEGIEDFLDIEAVLFE